MSKRKNHKINSIPTGEPADEGGFAAPLWYRRRVLITGKGA